MPVLIDSEIRSALLHHARAVVAACAQGEEALPPPAELKRRVREVAHDGCFVSLHGPWGLRGCIGTFEARGSLAEVVASMAARAACHDPRFPPVRCDEVAGLAVHISVLTPRSACRSPEEIAVGQHGVELRVGSRRAVFLPRVAVEQGWDRSQLLEALCQKARLPPAAWRGAGAQLLTFEALEFGEPAPSTGGAA